MDHRFPGPAESRDNGCEDKDFNQSSADTCNHRVILSRFGSQCQAIYPIIFVMAIEIEWDNWDEDTGERDAIREFSGPPRARRKRKKSRELSSSEKAQREVDNRRRARVNARKTWDADRLTPGDRMNRSVFLQNRLQVIRARHQGADTPTLKSWALEPRVVSIIKLPDNHLLLRNPGSLSKASRRSKSCMDLYHRLPGFHLGTSDPTEISESVVREALGPDHGAQLISGPVPWTSPIDRIVWVSVFEADCHNPDRWGWRQRPVSDHDLAPDEAAIIDAFIGSRT